MQEIVYLLYIKSSSSPDLLVSIHKTKESAEKSKEDYSYYNVVIVEKPVFE